MKFSNFSRFAQNVQKKFKQVTQDLNAALQTEQAKAAGNYLFNVVVVILGFYLLFSGLSAIISPLAGLVLLGAAVFNSVDPGCVTKPIASAIRNVIDGLWAITNSVADFFKKTFSFKPKPVDNKGELESEPEPIVPATESNTSYFSGAYDCLTNMFTRSKAADGLDCGNSVTNSTGGPIIALPSESFAADRPTGAALRPVIRG